MKPSPACGITIFYLSKAPCACRLNQSLIQSQGRPLPSAIAALKQALPPTAILVGQSIGKDVDWLGLVEGQDFEVDSPCRLSSPQKILLGSVE